MQRHTRAKPIKTQNQNPADVSTMSLNLQCYVLNNYHLYKVSLVLLLKGDKHMNFHL